MCDFTFSGLVQLFLTQFVLHIFADTHCVATSKTNNYFMVFKDCQQFCSNMESQHLTLIEKFCNIFLWSGFIVCIAGTIRAITLTALATKNNKQRQALNV
ncbi:unnamed protein product [Paramecium octaurelia]|uniref:Uncharacterized protein n=1 Tax=Paramecium octaurelia TaxID=43137 RepID=A0A8S1YQX2_PAROT|nr:unnamed protein product [Paramecium octaurelia]